MFYNYVIRILSLEGLVTTNAQRVIPGVDPMCGLSIRRSVSKILD